MTENELKFLGLLISFIYYWLFSVSLYYYMKKILQKEMKIVNDKMNIFEEKTRKTLEENAKNNKLDNDNQINELKKEIKFLRDNLSKKTQQISKLEKNQKVFCNAKQQNDIDNQK